jgi:hypothetical protein
VWEKARQPQSNPRRGLYFNSGESVKAGLAQSFDLAGITKTEGCPVLRVVCEGRESEMSAQVGLDYARCIANQIAQSASPPHPCNERKSLP